MYICLCVCVQVVVCANFGVTFELRRAASVSRGGRPQTTRYFFKEQFSNSAQLKICCIAKVIEFLNI